ncbi:hypothetical protein DNHGIG_25880 [Collibacillus ludicampi]|uniref:Uncharacterized protein n=1 Tax=Collibacillus ludicampi TaxID=2771369 RepID=A0AAV4LGV6_9BACL|nr:hypothetical protein [Collibacillus ludicampi]GIM47039.1 hypothetical protein DNHGIG_25880 [Collibacillus ludicampi]
MAKDRILGSSATIELYTPNGVLSIEVDSFSKNQKHEIKTWHPLGEVGEHHQVIYKGWEMDFKTGKIDDQIANFFDTLDQMLLAGQAAPRVRVVETIKHFDGNNEVWIYPDTVLYGYKGDASNAEDEIKEEFKGACTKRIRG